jgi:hypothetical protein
MEIVPEFEEPIVETLRRIEGSLWIPSFAIAIDWGGHNEPENLLDSLSIPSLIRLVWGVEAKIRYFFYPNLPSRIILANEDVAICLHALIVLKCTGKLFTCSSRKYVRLFSFELFKFTLKGQTHFKFKEDSN